VPAGATIVFINSDSAPHTATAEAAAGDYASGAVQGGWLFGASLSAGGTASIVVPATVTSGTDQPYFCNVHKGMMSNPDPVIHIE